MGSVFGRNRQTGGGEGLEDICILPDGRRPITSLTKKERKSLGIDVFKPPDVMVHPENYPFFDKDKHGKKGKDSKHSSATTRDGSNHSRVSTVSWEPTPFSPMPSPKPSKSKPPIASLPKARLQKLGIDVLKPPDLIKSQWQNQDMMLVDDREGRRSNRTWRTFQFLDLNKPGFDRRLSKSTKEKIYSGSDRDVRSRIGFGFEKRPGAKYAISDEIRKYQDEIQGCEALIKQSDSNMAQVLGIRHHGNALKPPIQQARQYMRDVEKMRRKKLSYCEAFGEDVKLTCCGILPEEEQVAEINEEVLNALHIQEHNLLFPALPLKSGPRAPFRADKDNQPSRFPKGTTFYLSRTWKEDSEKIRGQMTSVAILKGLPSDSAKSKSIRYPIRSDVSPGPGKTLSDSVERQGGSKRAKAPIGKRARTRVKKPRVKGKETRSVPKHGKHG